MRTSLTLRVRAKIPPIPLINTVFLTRKFAPFLIVADIKQARQLFIRPTSACLQPHRVPHNTQCRLGLAVCATGQMPDGPVHLGHIWAGGLRCFFVCMYLLFCSLCNICPAAQNGLAAHLHPFGIGFGLHWLISVNICLFMTGSEVTIYTCPLKWMRPCSR